LASGTIPRRRRARDGGDRRHEAAVAFRRQCRQVLDDLPPALRAADPSTRSTLDTPPSTGASAITNRSPNPAAGIA